MGGLVIIVDKSMIRKILTTPVLYGFRQNLISRFSTVKDFKAKLEQKDYFGVLGTFRDIQTFPQLKRPDSRTVKTSTAPTSARSGSITLTRSTTRKPRRSTTRSPSASHRPTRKSRRATPSSSRQPRRPTSSPMKIKLLRGSSERGTTISK